MSYEETQFYDHYDEHDLGTPMFYRVHDDPHTLTHDPRAVTRWPNHHHRHQRISLQCWMIAFVVLACMMIFAMKFQHIYKDEIEYRDSQKLHFDTYCHVPHRPFSNFQKTCFAIEEELHTNVLWYALYETSHMITRPVNPCAQTEFCSVVLHIAKYAMLITALKWIFSGAFLLLLWKTWTRFKQGTRTPRGYVQHEFDEAAAKLVSLLANTQKKWSTAAVDDDNNDKFTHEHAVH